MDENEETISELRDHYEKQIKELRQYYDKQIRELASSVLASEQRYDRISEENSWNKTLVGALWMVVLMNALGFVAMMCVSTLPPSFGLGLVISDALIFASSTIKRYLENKRNHERQQRESS